MNINIIMRKAFTLMEVVVSIAILGILSAGTLVSVKHLYIRASKSKTISDFSSDSQVISDQISSLLYSRVPSTVIGYDPNSSNFESIYNIDTSFPILEWIGIASEAMRARQYSGFVDLDGSDKDSRTILSYGLKGDDLNTTEFNKFGISYTYDSPNDKNVTALIFAGAFDDGDLISSDEFNSSFGWHGNGHNLTYDITKISDNNITLSIKPKEIYEKYYVVDSAYAIARGADINISTCRDKTSDDTDNTLYLFYNYRPWKGETFCADPKDNGTREGNVTILSKNVTGFKSGMINDSIYFDLTLNKQIRGSDNNVTISKQKVVF